MSVLFVVFAKSSFGFDSSSTQMRTDMYRQPLYLSNVVRFCSFNGNIHKRISLSPPSLSLSRLISSHLYITHLCPIRSVACQPGDGMRPCGRQVQLAQIVEMIHTASLAHDDVLDEADTRRSHQSINHKQQTTSNNNKQQQ